MAASPRLATSFHESPPRRTRLASAGYAVKEGRCQARKRRHVDRDERSVSHEKSRRRRSVSRILSSRPESGSSSHSSGPPVARGLERPTRGNGRAARARSSDRTSLYAVLLRVGFTEHPPSRADLVSSYLAVSPLLRTRGPQRSSLCGTFPRSLGAAVSGHPALWSPDFPPAAEASSGCSTSSGEDVRRLSVGLFAFCSPI
jgi:hypothetical protein